MTMTATGYESGDTLKLSELRTHDQVLAGQRRDPEFCLAALLEALAPFIRCEAGTKGGSCWPRCDGPERRALVEAVEALKGEHVRTS